MYLLTILISLAFLSQWSGRSALHQDQWFNNLLEALARSGAVARRPRLLLGLALVIPAVFLLIIMLLVASISDWLLLPLGIAVLLYSFGRQSMEEALDAYTSAYACENWHFGVQQAGRLQVDTGSVQAQDWSRLHEQVLEAGAYRGFERLFAVLFWFLLLGPVGALLYRLSALYRERNRGLPAAERWLWLLEWPAVRVLGVSFAITGNFVGCLRQWRDCLFCASRRTGDVLVQAVLGALSVDDEVQELPCVSRRELAALQGLYRRTLWLWLVAIGLWTIMS